ncbi:Pleckstrin homology domain-containing protein [Mycena alexandri]|uniref:Pleckstrin homology domain-containing protein n=1 Tax=Mycena alexandri TaxID=1745969 RepID=A0AAD6XG53_9AGAR|nr:Pleckstrin homology domain-containing protein [Mycena alexandri]
MSPPPPPIPTIIVEPSDTLPVPPPLTQSSSNRSKTASENAGGQHAHRRMFIGPMPEKVVPMADPRQKDKKRRHFRVGSTDGDDDDDISKIIREHAFAFFIQEGGNEEDWGEREQSVREEMLRRWRETEWGAIWGRRKQSKEPKQAKKWIGGSFEVGDLLGVNILHEPAESIRDRMSTRSARNSNRSARSPRRPFVASSSSHLLSVHSVVESPEDEYTGMTSFFTPQANSDSVLLRPLTTGDESGRRTQSDFAARPILETSTPAVKSDTHVPGVARQRVHYAEPPQRENGSGADSPAPPSEVLERSASDLPGTSAEAMSTPREVPWGEVVMRDRMLVRIGYTKSEAIGPVFDEEQSRKTRGVRYDEWAEYIVLWRKDFIHFYEPHNVPGTKWLTGSKYRLAFVVPLKSPKTRLALYSFVDLTFCLTCPPASYHSRDSKARAIFRRTKEGTNIFICKVKSRSRAADWMWSIWRRLGGLLPPTLEILNPSLGTRVRIEMPGIEAPEMFTRENIISLCMQSLRRVKDWKELIELQLSGGKELELAWRLGTQLDWVWLDTDVQGQQRDCAVLCGLAMQQGFPSPHLEVRLGQHSPQHFVLRNGTRVPEPPAIEGYLERIRPNSQAKHLIYLVTHDGNLFSLASEDANPPAPMGIGQSADTPEALRLSEVQRGTTQVLKATGVSDMRAILAVRRAFQLVVPASHDTHDPGEDQSFVSRNSHIERTDSDDEDGGGEEGLRTAPDKSHLRMKRSFELLLKNGHIIRFEAHSRKVAVEWIERLQALIGYWKQRHRIDANEEMDLAQAYRPRLTPRRHVMRNDSQIAPEAPVDTSAPLPALGNLYSWCVLQGCKPVIRGGKVFIRQGLYGQYKFVQLILLPGHLAQFRIRPQSSLHLAMHKSINLADAYVCSGYFAALTLPDGQYTSDNALPRRYQDGLETDDADEDTLFMLWYHPHRAAVNVALELPEGEDNAKPRGDAPRLPSLSSKRKLAVVRCRNKLERDAWCWALNSEIEKIVRIQQDREDKLRNTGGSLRS